VAVSPPAPPLSLPVRAQRRIGSCLRFPPARCRIAPRVTRGWRRMGSAFKWNKSYGEEEGEKRLPSPPISFPAISIGACWCCEWGGKDTKTRGRPRHTKGGCRSPLGHRRPFGPKPPPLPLLLWPSPPEFFFPLPRWNREEGKERRAWERHPYGRGGGGERDGTGSLGFTGSHYTGGGCGGGSWPSPEGKQNGSGGASPSPYGGDVQ